MRDPLAVGERQPQGDLFEDPKGARPLQPLPSVLEGAEAPSAQVAGHDVGATGLPPVVVDGGDVRMLQGGDGLGVPFEPTDELGVGRDPSWTILTATSRSTWGWMARNTTPVGPSSIFSRSR